MYNLKCRVRINEMCSFVHLWVFWLCFDSLGQGSNHLPVLLSCSCRWHRHGAMPNCLGLFRAMCWALRELSAKKKRRGNRRDLRWWDLGHPLRPSLSGGEMEKRCETWWSPAEQLHDFSRLNGEGLWRCCCSCGASQELPHGEPFHIFHHLKDLMYAINTHELWFRYTDLL